MFVVPHKEYTLSFANVKPSWLGQYKCSINNMIVNKNVENSSCYCWVYSQMLRWGSVLNTKYSQHCLSL